MTRELRDATPGLAPDRAPETFTSLNPRTGQVLAEYPVADEADVAGAVERARGAARWWDAQGFRGRRDWLLEFKKAIAADAEDLARVVSAETGKPHDDALLEVMLAVEHLDWAARNAKKVLRARRVSPGLVSANQSATLGYHPLGVVGVIGPWNYPVYTPMGSISYALAAGNAIVFKPSELTPGVGKWLEARWNALAPTQPVLQVITGLGATGAALCRAGVDKIAFTGSGPTARKVMAVCAETLTPLVAECGGKDAMLVAEDADLDKAVEFAAFGAFGNAGQTCAGVERIYVAEPVYQQFLDKLTSAVDRVRPGGTDADTYGPMTLPRQADVVRNHIADALDKGARAVIGGIDSVHERFVDPVILTDVPESSSAVCEETFGPTVVVNRVRDLEEGIERANATSYGLGASVFTRNRSRGRDIAQRLRAGMVSVNSVLGFAGVPSLPFGGSGESGFGRIHGADGLREFSRPKAVTVERFSAPLKLMTLERSVRDMRVSAWMLKTRHGR
ncbi:aldehyde dehydrogenase family protein [Rhodococcus sp. SGAir0479]|uniref:aldehyde dehydrogenase family protein n=1 Tax=Rhodococcus sp. SGAir0479 TaxID=2567884 RepID=UPI0010CD6B67|nr:aldehyde dehydrogenase family protein [Rhodococcus sp. SGAir0479]QCQ93351.1 aldehyde dehydrogenase family protein [Rhodococcus sp. SGAir0479]